MSNPNKSPLQTLLQGVPMPNPPEFRPDWTLDRYQQEMVEFHRKLLDYIRRLMGVFTSKNLLMETSVNIGDFRYDTTSKQLQVRRYDANGKLKDWEMITGGQAVEYP